MCITCVSCNLEYKGTWGLQRDGQSLLLQRPSWHPTSAQQNKQLFAKLLMQFPQCWQQCCVQDADITQPAVHSLFFSYCCRKQQEYDDPPHCFPPPTCWETGTIQSESLCSPRGSPVSRGHSETDRHVGGHSDHRTAALCNLLQVSSLLLCTVSSRRTPCMAFVEPRNHSGTSGECTSPARQRRGNSIIDSVLRHSRIPVRHC